MKRLIFILTLHLLTVMLFGGEIDSIKALKAGTAFFSMYKSAAAKPFAGLHLVNYGSAVTHPYYYVINKSDQGYVIIAGNDNITPILGYSHEGKFDPDNVPPNLKDWLALRENEIKHIVENEQVASEEIKNDWDNLLSGKFVKSATSSSGVLPLISTYWGQGANYNSLCPYDTVEDSYTKTGCVATAMAQIMKYWNFPINGTGTKTYTDPTYGMLSANFGATTYQWDSMPGNVKSPNTAVATLMFHCGVSVSMQYGVSGSTANSSEGAYITYFKYKNTLDLKARKDYSDLTWTNMLKNELDLGHPIHYRGTGSEGGHAFICDGYTSGNYFHFNWGWNGSYNGYFLVSALNPGESDFTSSQAAIFGIVPNLPSVGITPSSITVSSDVNNTPSFRIASNTAWTITGMPDWLSVSVSSGSGCANVLINFLSANTTGTDRTDTLVITATGLTPEKVIVTQLASTALLPNLKPHRPSGWDDIITVNKVKNSAVGFSNFTPNDTVYTRFALINTSAVATSGIFHVWLLLDSLQIGQYTRSTTLTGGNYIYQYNINVGKLRFGNHTLSISIDHSNLLPESDESDNVYSKTFTIYGFSVSSPLVSLQASTGSVGFFSISSNTSWSVTDIPAWLSLSASSGTGDATVTITALGNTSNLPRSDTITITSTEGFSQSIVVTQQAPFLTVTPTSWLFALTDNDKDIIVRSNADWTASGNQSWLSLSSLQGKNNDTVTVYAEANNTAGSRSATVTFTAAGVSAKIITFTQPGNSTGNPENKDDGISLYPNPVVDNVCIHSLNKLENIIITTLAGRVVCNKTINDWVTSIDISSIPSGFYIVRLKTKENIIIRQFIKQYY